MKTKVKMYVHKNLDWYILGEFDNRIDATEKKQELLDKMEKGEIAKGTLEVVDRKINTKTKEGMRKGKFYLLGIPKK